MSDTTDENAAITWWAEVGKSPYDPREWCGGADVKFVEARRGRDRERSYDWVRITFVTVPGGKEYHKLGRNPPWNGDHAT